MSAGEITALVVSGIAVATAIGSLGVSILALTRDRPNVRVTCTWGYPTDNVRDVQIMATAINIGRHVEVVDAFQFFDDRGAHLVLYSRAHFGGALPPITLDAGKSVKAMVGADSFAQTWKTMGKPRYLRVQVQSDRKYTCDIPDSIAHFLQTGERRDTAAS